MEEGIWKSGQGVRSEVESLERVVECRHAGNNKSQTVGLN